MAQSASAVGDNGHSDLTTTVNGPATLTFWWKVDSEEGFDYLNFAVEINLFLEKCPAAGPGLVTLSNDAYRVAKAHDPALIECLRAGLDGLQFPAKNVRDQVHVSFDLTPPP